MSFNRVARLPIQRAVRAVRAVTVANQSCHSYHIPSSSLSSFIPSCLYPSRLFSMRSGPDSPHTAPRPSSFAVAAVSTRVEGEVGTTGWRLFFSDNGRDISPWHDIPLIAKGSTANQIMFNYINEIPKGTRPKMEIATKETGNPIKQDVKKGKLRLFTYGDLPFNYGCLPQTWENPHDPHPLTKLNGDNDPIDVVEISEAPLAMGDVRAVKVLGVLALLDEGETDWKLICIDAQHPLADSIKSVVDVDVHFPGKLSSIRNWFQYYKTTDGKGENSFAFNGEIKDIGMAQAVIWETHAAWAQLCRKEIPANELAIPQHVPKAAKGQ